MAGHTTAGHVPDAARGPRPWGPLGAARRPWPGSGTGELEPGGDRDHLSRCTRPVRVQAGTEDVMKAALEEDGAGPEVEVEAGAGIETEPGGAGVVVAPKAVHARPAADVGANLGGPGMAELVDEI